MSIIRFTASSGGAGRLCTTQGRCKINRTRIGWVLNDDGSQGFTWNPLKGRCPNACPYCYADDIRKRWKMYDGPLKLDEVELQRPLKRKKPCTIFVCSMNELFLWNFPSIIINAALDATRHRYLFLSKHPGRMDKYAYPEDSWLGVTVTNQNDTHQLGFLGSMHIYNLFISAEPLLGPIAGTCPRWLNWLIIGSLNKNGSPVPADKGGTRIEWVLPLLERADKLGIPVFIKKELLRLYPELPFRQEIPWVWWSIISDPWREV